MSLILALYNITVTCQVLLVDTVPQTVGYPADHSPPYLGRSHLPQLCDALVAEVGAVRSANDIRAVLQRTLMKIQQRELGFHQQYNNTNNDNTNKNNNTNNDDKSKQNTH